MGAKQLGCSLAAAVLSFVAAPFVGGLAAVIAERVAQRQISAAAQQGWSLAHAGILLGTANNVLCLVSVLLMFDLVVAPHLFRH